MVRNQRVAFGETLAVFVELHAGDGANLAVGWGRVGWGRVGWRRVGWRRVGWRRVGWRRAG